MRIKISKRQLLAQLPAKIRTDLVSVNDLPDFFEFDYDEDWNKADDTSAFAKDLRLQSEYENVAKVLTDMQWFLFSVMVKSHPSVASMSLLSGRLKGSRNNSSNTIAVHMKELRRALKNNHLPFEVESVRGGLLGGGGYRLIKK